MNTNGALTVVPPLPLNDIERMGTVMAKSRLFGFKTADEAVALMLIAQAEGNHPAKAAQEYHVIQGRPALKADAMLARFQAAGGVVQWEELTDSNVSALFSHPTACPKPVRVDWSMDRARQAGLTGKDNWNKYPRQMLKARVVSEGVRTTYPGVAVGIYTPEEVMQFDDSPSIPTTITGKLVGSDVPHITKSERMAIDISGKKDDPEEKPPAQEGDAGKTRGNVFDVMDRLKRATTARGVGQIVSRMYKSHTFTQKERDQIESAAELRQESILAEESMPEEFVSEK